MNWHELAENPSTISELYRDIPSLQSLYIIGVALSHDDARLHIKANLSRFPDYPPPDWKPRSWNRSIAMVDFNVAQIELAFINLVQLQIIDWPIEQNVDALIDVNVERYISLEALYPDGALRAIAQRLRIIGIHGYHQE